MTDAMSEGKLQGGNSTMGTMAEMMMGAQMAGQMMNNMNGMGMNNMNQQPTNQQAAPAGGAAVTPGAKFCPNCGTPTNGAKFCSNCGQQLG